MNGEKTSRNQKAYTSQRDVQWLDLEQIVFFLYIFHYLEEHWIVFFWSEV